MLMEQEAPLLFHTVFAGAVILTVAYLLHWRASQAKKAARADPLFCPFTDPGLHLGLLRYDVSRFRREDLRFRNGRFCWLIGILVLMQGIRDLLDYNTNKKDPPK